MTTKRDHEPGRADEPTKAPIAEQEFIVLSARDRPVFFDTLVNPPAPSERLQRAFAQRERRVLR
jgi:uncharacterized protein (DUF1778 family)